MNKKTPIEKNKEKEIKIQKQIAFNNSDQDLKDIIKLDAGKFVIGQPVVSMFTENGIKLSEKIIQENMYNEMRNTPRKVLAIADDPDNKYGQTISVGDYVILNPDQGVPTYFEIGDYIFYVFERREIIYIIKDINLYNQTVRLFTETEKVD